MRGGHPSPQVCDTSFRVLPRAIATSSDRPSATLSFAHQLLFCLALTRLHSFVFTVHRVVLGGWCLSAFPHSRQRSMVVYYRLPQINYRLISAVCAHSPGSIVLIRGQAQRLFGLDSLLVRRSYPQHLYTNSRFRLRGRQVQSGRNLRLCLTPTTSSLCCHLESTYTTTAPLQITNYSHTTQDVVNSP